jgi:hypothetical protein
MSPFKFQPTRSRRPILRTAVAAFLIAASMASAPSMAAASVPRRITIAVDTTEGGNDAFLATGGVVCDAGIVTTSFRMFSGNARTGGLQLLLVKHFRCSDGAFDLLVRVSLEFSTGTAGTWSVLSGTERYEGLHGSGSITGTYGPNDTIHDVYVGSMQ